ncbi:oxidoreductase [Bradymonas sediminis]|uniref:Oxidoreductase n=2 Tax=Bradymonas sediminis TaxID=1548548 RepID=A0A2Z4FR85_9DELT|nr:oxidoreductase [Bradymonas sediminis]
MAAGMVSRPGKRARKKLARARLKKEKQQRREHDEALMDQTEIREKRSNPVFLTPRWRDASKFKELAAAPASEPIGQTEEERTCYVCRDAFTDVHFFYDQMCIKCGDFNYAKRSQTADLRGRVALVTGSRVKIGYQAAILLLRAGASVICTTRFPHDAARRYAAEEDFDEWKDRLKIYGIDLRHTPSVENFCAELNRTLDRLDFIINNACQTVRRPSGFYDHLMAAELGAEEMSPDELALVGTFNPTTAASGLLADGGSELDTTQKVTSAHLSQVELLAEDGERGHHLFPAGELDADLQQVDLRKVNSWRLKLDEVSAIEMLEVHLVNAVAPFIINARLKRLMEKVPTADKHIVNVSAMEGQFYRVFKTDRHPHTNMAKAGLNMMTRTSAPDYIESGIHMNSVDTGWVTDEDPDHHARLKRELHRFHPPLDIVDGAARIVDPILHGINTGEHVWGQFLKDYKITDW